MIQYVEERKITVSYTVKQSVHSLIHNLTT